MKVLPVAVSERTNWRFLRLSTNGEVDGRSEFIDPPEQIAGGMLAVNERPGFGIELNTMTL